MNADLEAVSRKHGKMGHPLRHRSASSNSAEGSVGRPDPNRYMKYLSLRNRKIVEGKQRVAPIEESSSHHTSSHRTLDSHVQD